MFYHQAEAKSVNSLVAALTRAFSEKSWHANFLSTAIFQVMYAAVILNLVVVQVAMFLHLPVYKKDAMNPRTDATTTYDGLKIDFVSNREHWQWGILRTKQVQSDFGGCICGSHCHLLLAWLI
jgi:hypothetical protein